MRNLAFRQRIVDGVIAVSAELRQRIETRSPSPSSWRSAIALRDLLSHSEIPTDPIACLGDTLRSLEEADALHRLEAALSAALRDDRHSAEHGGAAPEVRDLLYALSRTRQAFAQPSILGDATTDLRTAQAMLTSRGSAIERSVIVDFHPVRYGYGLELRFGDSDGANRANGTPIHEAAYRDAIQLLGIQRLRAHFPEPGPVARTRCRVDSARISRAGDMLALTLTFGGHGSMHAEFDAVTFVRPSQDIQRSSPLAPL